MQRVSTPKSGILVQNWPKNPILWQILLAEIRGWGFLIKNVLMRRYFIFARCLPPGSAPIYFLSKNQVHKISGWEVVNFLTQDRNQKNVENWRVRVSYKNMFLRADSSNFQDGPPLAVIPSTSCPKIKFITFLGGGVVNFLTQDRNQKNVENWRVRVSYKNMFLWTDKKIWRWQPDGRCHELGM